jgi:hypothetical protein
MYGSMVFLFPFVHSVFALTTLSTCPRGERIGLSRFMISKNPGTNHCDLVNNNEDFSNKISNFDDSDDLMNMGSTASLEQWSLWIHPPPTPS